MKRYASIGWLLVACLAAASYGAETPLSVRIELAATGKPGSIDIDNPFRIVVTNTSDKPVSIWNPRRHEGYYQFSFHFVNVRTHAEDVARKVEIADPEFWELLAREAGEGSEAIRIAPRGEVGFQIQFNDVAWGKRGWTGLPDPNSADRLSLSVEMDSKGTAPKGDPTTSIGRLRSPELVVAFLASRMRTPHDYLARGFPHKALEIMSADHTWISRHGENELTPLHLAASYGYPDVAKWLLENGADVNAIAYNGFTPLHLAKDRRVIALLLAKHPDLSIRDGAHNQTAPQRAATNFSETRSEPERRECQAILDLYVAHGGPIDLLTAVTVGDLVRVKIRIGGSRELADNFQGQSLLRKAASLGHLEICRYLIDEYHVDVDDFERGSGYPIIKEALQHPKVVRLLIERGANLKKPITWQGGRTGVWIIGDDATALHYAAEDGVPETVKLLLDHGVDLFANTKSFDGRVQEQTALDVAAIFGQPENAIAMLEHPSFQRADPALKKRVLNRCLPLAASATDWSYGRRKLQSAKLVEALLSHGADPNATERGVTALQAAAQKIWPGQEKPNQQLREVVAVLRKHGARLDLFSAVAIGDEEQVAKLLAKNPASANARDACGHPAMHLAVGMNYEKIVKQLLAAGCDVEIANECSHIGHVGDTPLHEAAFWGRYAIAQELIRKRANVNATTSRGQWTPLHDALYMNNLKIARLLLESGAKWDAKTDKGETPLDIAHLSREGDIATVGALLREYQNKKRDGTKK
jgi:ankyrin repeat protein